MQARANRTFICSVVFADLVEYSQQPVADQIRIKERFNAVLAESLRDVPAGDRIILDTGDGAAVTFLGDPEDALLTAMTVREELAAGVDETASPPVRIGINLGPVKLIKDINGQPNIIGDGINAAQRVMAFAEPGQILVSRAYFDVVARLDEGYAKLFEYQGSRTDKHVREHEIYAVGKGAPPVQRAAPAAPAQAPAILPAPVAPARNRLLRFGLPLAMIVIVGGALLVRGLRAPKPAAAPAVSAAQPQKPAPAAAEVPPPPPPAETHKSAPKLRAAERRPAPATPAAPTSPLPAATPAVGRIEFAITPWGEIYVDGRKEGIAPPLIHVEVKAGRHKIEVRNADLPPHIREIEVEAGASVKIKHKFQ